MQTTTGNQIAPAPAPAPAQSKINEYHAMEVRIALILQRHQGLIIDVTSTKGMDEARKARADLRSCRVDMEKIRTETKAPLLERERLIDSEAKRIITQVTAEETLIDTKIKAEETRIEAEKAEKVRLEKARVDGIQARITALRNLPLSMMGKTSDELSLEVHKVENLDISTSFDEFLSEAAIVHTYIVEKLHEMYQSKKDEEENLAKIQTEREELKRERLAHAIREAQSVDAANKAKDEIAAQEARLAADRMAHEALMKEKQAALQIQIDALDNSGKKPALAAVKVAQVQQTISPVTEQQMQYDSLLSEACVDLARFVDKYNTLNELDAVMGASRAFITTQENIKTKPGQVVNFLQKKFG